MTKPLPEFSAQDLEVVQRTPGYRGFFAIDEVILKHRLYAGGWSPSFTRELFLRDPSAGVLLYDPDRDQLVMVEQFRIGAVPDAQNKGTSPWLLEVVAGILGPQESAAQLAQREAKEEAGCDIQDLVHITVLWSCRCQRRWRNPWAGRRE